MAIINAALRIAADAYRHRAEPVDPVRTPVRPDREVLSPEDSAPGMSFAGRVPDQPTPGMMPRAAVVQQARPAIRPSTPPAARPAAGTGGRPGPDRPAGGPDAMGRPPAETARRLPGKLPSTRPEGSGPARTPVAPASGRPPAHPAAAGAHPSDRWKTADEWKLRAECSPADTELFFSKDPVEKRAALAICADCPVARECLAEAMAQEQGMNLHGRYGIRGGLQPAERLDLARGGPKRRGKPRAGRRKKTGAA